jgi:anti-anti-sigma factor
MMEMEPSVRVELNQVAEHVWVVRVRGDHDLSNSSEIDAALAAAFEGGSRIVVDLTEATFIDSSVLGILAQAHDRAMRTPDHQLAVVAPPGGMPRRVLELTGLDTRMKLFDSTDAAI